MQKQQTFGDFAPLEAVRMAFIRVHNKQPALDVYTSTGLTPAWQQAFAEGRSKDPAYTRIVKLIEWLRAHHDAILTEEVNKRQ